MKKNDETKAIKVKRYKNRMKTADKAPYLMRVVSNGEVHLDDILQEVAKQTGWAQEEQGLHQGHAAGRTSKSAREGDACRGWRP